MSRTGLYTVDELYALLPQMHLVADDARGGPLRELLEVITEQVNVLAESMEQFHDDQFIETAADWVTPYIGDLIGYRTLHGVVPAVASPRAEVANTIGYRRRKGTASMLEQLARDVTGWPASAVESFELLASTQWLNHVRPHAPATASMRGADTLDLGGVFQAGAFDGLAHTAEMRRIATGGRWNIPNVALFLWRVQAQELVRSPLVAADAGGHRWLIDPLGTDRPLFSAGRTEEDIGHMAQPRDLPIPLRRRWLGSHLADHWGLGSSLLLELDDATEVVELSLADVRVCDLSDHPAVPGTWTHEPTVGTPDIAIDPVLGRVAVGQAPAAGERLLATFHHGSAIAVGGGGYDRSASIMRLDPVVEVSGGGSLVAALGGVAGGGAVEVVDNERWVLPATITATTPDPTAAIRQVVLRSSNRTRPLLSRATGHAGLAMEPDTTIILEGLAIAGAPLVIDELADTDVRTLILRHCTLVPGLTRTSEGLPGSVGRASLIVLHPFANIIVDHCVTGPIVAVEDTDVTAVATIIDATATDQVAFCGRDPIGNELRTVTTAADRETGDGMAPGGHLTLEACTVVGKVHATRLDVSNSILVAQRSGPTDPAVASVWAQRRQVGCIRFSALPADSRTPRQYQCVPRDDVASNAVAHHTSRLYGDAGYMQLRAATHPAIRTGASDESEMGVTHDLYQPQRETNLRIRLDEYLRFGLEAGFFYAT